MRELGWVRVSSGYVMYVSVRCVWVWDWLRGPFGFGCCAALLLVRVDVVDDCVGVGWCCGVGMWRVGPGERVWGIGGCQWGDGGVMWGDEGRG